MLGQFCTAPKHSCPSFDESERLCDFLVLIGAGEEAPADNCCVTVHGRLACQSTAICTAIACRLLRSSCSWGCHPSQHRIHVLWGIDGSSKQAHDEADVLAAASSEPSSSGPLISVHLQSQFVFELMIQMYNCTMPLFSLCVSAPVRQCNSVIVA
jgi:hypothetical protein